MSSKRNDTGSFGRVSGAGGDTRAAWLQTSAAGPSDLFRRTIDHLVVPYARAVAGEGYHLVADRFAERFGLDDGQREYLQQQLGINDHEALWTQGEYGNAHDWSIHGDPHGEDILNSRGLAGQPDLQAWLRDRRGAFDALYAEPSPAGDSSGIFQQSAAGAPRAGFGFDPKRRLAILLADLRLVWFLVRILVNFMQRAEVWFVHALADDAKTPITPIQQVRELGTLVRLLRYVGATDADIDQVQENVRRWSRGGVWIELAPGRMNLLRIRPPFDAGLLR
jgi:hypothetical protein